jgi:hypothetical protein
VVGNIFISLGFVVQRLVHTKNTKGIPYTNIPQWWLGLMFLAGGEIGNFLAYGMAPASLISPLGAVTGNEQKHHFIFVYLVTDSDCFELQLYQMQYSRGFS